VPYVEAKNLGVNLVALGNNKVLSMKGATVLNEKMRAIGYEVYDPDMSRCEPRNATESFKVTLQCSY